MNKRNVVYPYSGMLFNHKKEWITNTCYNLDEPRKLFLSEINQTQKVTVYDSIYMKYLECPYRNKDKKQIGVCQGLRGREGEWRITAYEYEVSFGLMKYSKINSDDVCTYLSILKTIVLCI